MYVLASYVGAFIAGAVVWHIYATKVLGFATRTVDEIKVKL